MFHATFLYKKLIFDCNSQEGIHFFITFYMDCHCHFYLETEQSGHRQLISFHKRIVYAGSILASDNYCYSKYC